MILHRDDTFRVVVKITTPEGDAEAIGTGMFVVKGERSPYLVTASHVAKATTDSTEVILADAAGAAAKLKLSAFNRRLAWKHHTVADVSALPIVMNARLAYHMDKRCLGFNQFHTEKVPVSRDCELTSVGFPHGLGADGIFSPLSFRSYASSGFVTLERNDSHTPQDFFLLENASVGGYSGAGVFDLGYRMVGGVAKRISDEAMCYGIVHGTLTDKAGGNLAAITPAHYLKDFL
jgi:hypothetical protein